MSRASRHPRPAPSSVKVALADHVASSRACDTRPYFTPDAPHTACLTVRLLVVALNGVVLTLMAAAVLSAQLQDRSSAPILASVERYAHAMAALDLPAAREEIAPAARVEWDWFLAEQLGNIYEVQSISIRSPSLLDQWLHGDPPMPFEATVRLDVNRGYPDFFYQPTTRVPLRQVDGRWYLAEPLLAPAQTSAG